MAPLPRLLLSVNEAGALLGISGQSVRRLVASGKLPGVYVPLPGGEERLKIHARHVEQYAARLADEAEAALPVADLGQWRKASGRR